MFIRLPYRVSLLLGLAWSTSVELVGQRFRLKGYIIPRSLDYERHLRAGGHYTAEGGARLDFLEGFSMRSIVIASTLFAIACKGPVSKLLSDRQIDLEMLPMSCISLQNPIVMIKIHNASKEVVIIDLNAVFLNAVYGSSDATVPPDVIYDPIRSTDPNLVEIAAGDSKIEGVAVSDLRYYSLIPGNYLMELLYAPVNSGRRSPQMIVSKRGSFSVCQ